MSDEQIKTPGPMPMTFRPPSLIRHFGTIKRQDQINGNQMKRLLMLDGAFESIARIVETVSGPPGSEQVAAMRKLLEALDCAQRAVFDTPDVTVTLDDAKEAVKEHTP